MSSTAGRRFGDIRQIGYVVDDLDAAVDQWVTLLDVGPFFVARRLHVIDFLHRGEPSDPEISVALAQSGTIQIELIQQHDDEPSAYTEFRGAAGRGAHHVAYWTQEFDRDFAACEGHGITVVQFGRSVSGGPNERFVYFHPTDRPELLIELSEVLGWKEQWLTLVADAARSWDRSEPVRPAPAITRTGGEP